MGRAALDVVRRPDRSVDQGRALATVGVAVVIHGTATSAGLGATVSDSGLDDRRRGWGWCHIHQLLKMLSTFCQ